MGSFFKKSQTQLEWWIQRHRRCVGVGERQGVSRGGRAGGGAWQRWWCPHSTVTAVHAAQVCAHNRLRWPAACVSHHNNTAQLGRLRGLSTGLRTRGWLVRFPVRAHAWVVVQVPSRGHERGNHTLIFLFLYSSFPSPLSKN